MGRKKHLKGSVGDLVRSVRRQAGLNQVDFAEKLGVGQSYLSAVERGVKPLSDDVKEVLIAHFGVSAQMIEQAQITEKGNNADSDDVPQDVPQRRNDVPQKPKTSAKQREAGQKGYDVFISHGDWQPTAEERAIAERMAQMARERDRQRTPFLASQARFYERHPALASTSLRLFRAASVLGFRTDMVLDAVRKQVEADIEAVLVQVFDRKLDEAEGVERIRALTEPLNALQGPLEALETATMKLLIGVTQHYPDKIGLLHGAHFLLDLTDTLQEQTPPKSETA